MAGLAKSPSSMKPDPQPEPIERILADNPQIEGVRIDPVKRDLEIGFTDSMPAAQVLEKIDASLHRELPDPDVVMHSPEVLHPPGTNGAGARIHHHHLGAGVIEFHRGDAEPRAVVWRSFKMPRWQNRPARAAEGPDYRVMLLLSGVCGITALAGYFLGRAEAMPRLVVLVFAAAYVSGGWYAAREVFGELRHGTIDVHFLMLVVAIGVLFVNAWAEGATLLFLFSLSSGLEQFARYRTQKTISSLLNAAPKQALRRSADAWVEVAIEEVQPADELLVKPGELFRSMGWLSKARLQRMNRRSPGSRFPSGNARAITSAAAP
jgi:Cd2+/Zn2+-exporting ATPase